MSRNAISANSEHYIFKIRPETIFSRCRMAQKFFSGSTLSPPPPEQKILDHVYRQIFQSAPSIKFLTKLFRILNLSKIRKINLIF